MDRRALLLDAALEIIGEDGLAAFSQPKVAARARMRQSHLTYYFATRSELLRAVAEEAVRRRVTLLQAAMAVAAPQERVTELARVFANPANTRILVALVECADTDPGVHHAFTLLTREVMPVSVTLLHAFGITPTPATLGLVQATSTGISVLGLAAGAENFDAKAEELLLNLLHSLQLSGPLDQEKRP